MTTTTLTIDLNADVSEGCGQDDKLLTIVSSANICCGCTQVHPAKCSKL